MNKILLFFLSIFFISLFLTNISNASLVWQISANGQVSTKPIAYSNGILVASSDGSAYLLNPTLGNQIWKASLPGTPTQPIIFSNKPVIALANGKIVMLKQDGKVEWTTDLGSQNVSTVYGADASISRIFISTDKGIFSLSASGGDIQNIYKSALIKTAPSATESSLLFGEGDSLVKISNKNGALEWKRNVGGIWLSRPVVDTSVVYVGGLDNKLHAIFLNTGAERWEVNTGGWVVGSALSKNNVVYFGSNDGYVYAVGALDGQVAWKTKTPLAIQTKPEYGQLGGKEVIFVGSTANQIFAMDSATGEIVWSSSTGGWVSDPLFNNKFIIFGSADKTIRAYSTQRACAILNPKEGDIIGHKEMKVSGNAISESGSPRVYISLNELPFEAANTSDMNWFFYIEPNQVMNVGLNTISCKVADSAGEESGELTSVGIVRDVNIPLSELVISTSGLKVEGDEFSVHVNDGDDGSPVEHFILKVDGKEFTGSNSVNISLAAGSYTLTVRKSGFNDAILKLDIASKGISPVYLAIAALLTMIVIWQAYERFIRKK